MLIDLRNRGMTISQDMMTNLDLTTNPGTSQRTTEKDTTTTTTSEIREVLEDPLLESHPMKTISLWPAKIDLNLQDMRVRSLIVRVSLERMILE